MSLRPPAARPVSRGRGGRGRAGAVMARAAVRESVTRAGRAERARAARAFVSEVLGSGHPCGDVTILLVSEIFSNGVRHSGSAAPGETVTVAVIAGDGVVRVEVTTAPGRGRRSCVMRGGRGLQLVAGLAARWGWRRRRGERIVTWFECAYGRGAVCQCLPWANRGRRISGGSPSFALAVLVRLRGVRVIDLAAGLLVVQ